MAVYLNLTNASIATQKTKMSLNLVFLYIVTWSVFTLYVPPLAFKCLIAKQGII